MRDFVVRAARELGVEIEWRGTGVEEQGLVSAAPADSALKVGQMLVAVDPRYFRPAEVETLLGDPTRARQRLGWTPTTTFAEMVKEMVESDLKIARRDAMVQRAGYSAPTYRE